MCLEQCPHVPSRFHDLNTSYTLIEEVVETVVHAHKNDTLGSGIRLLVVRVLEVTGLESLIGLNKCEVAKHLARPHLVV